MNYSLVLRKFYKSNEWSITGNSYAGLVWNDSATKPTDAELIAKYADAQSIETAEAEIKELQGKLLKTDYVGLSDYDQDKTAVKADRQTWRERIRTLETTIEGLMS